MCVILLLNVLILLYPMNLRISIVFINEIHILHFQLKKQNHLTFTKLKHNGSWHIAPEPIETDVSSMSKIWSCSSSINMLYWELKMCYYGRHSCNININVKFK